MRHNLKLHPEAVLVLFVVSSQPLIGHFVPDEEGVVGVDGLACHFEALAWVRVLKHPDGVVSGFELEEDLL